MKIDKRKLQLGSYSVLITVAAIVAVEHKAIQRKTADIKEGEYMPIPKAEEKEYYAMSSAQQRTYLIQQMDPESVVYNMPQNLKLTGEVRPEGTAPRRHRGRGL